MPDIIIVAYKLRPVDGYVPDMTGVSAPANYKSPEAIANWLEEKKLKMLAAAGQQPYTATFEEVRLFDMATGTQERFAYRAPAEKRDAACVAIKNWLLDLYPDAWPRGTQPPRMLTGEIVLPAADAPERRVPLTMVTATSPVIFVGFNPKRFLKVLGIDCSLPANQPVNDKAEPLYNYADMLPLSLWCANSDHRDIEELVRPSDYADNTPWSAILRARGLDRYAKWPGPHADTRADLGLTLELATQIGLWDKHD